MRGRPTKPKDMMAYLDPLLEIVFSGIRAPKEEQVIFVKVSSEEAKEAGLIIKCERLPDDKAGAKESRKKGKTGKTIKRKEKVLC